MSAALDPGTVILAASLPLDHEPLPPEQVLAGAPTTGWRVLDDRDRTELGVWEMTPGVATDVEVDEVFVVLFGDATLEHEDGGEPLELRPGSVVRLAAGSRTRWTVRSTLRKVYWAASA